MDTRRNRPSNQHSLEGVLFSRRVGQLGGYSRGLSAPFFAFSERVFSTQIKNVDRSSASFPDL